MKKINQSGFHLVELIIALAIVGLVGFIGYSVAIGGKAKTNSASQAGNSPKSKSSSASSSSSGWPTNTDAQWENSGDARGWISLQSPPACPEPLTMDSPADVGSATSVLYPGQTRGGNYKPHGGLRYDNTKDNKVSVKSPLPGYIYRGSRYLSEGEVQYTFDIINSCGIMVRLGHLRVLSDTFQRVADKFPPAQEGDSRTTRVEPLTAVKTGDSVATTVGLINSNNVFFDFGVYDLRRPNAISKTPAYQSAHADDKELSWHAVCWFDLLSSKDNSKIKSLPPGDPASGKNSDYCK